MKEEDDKSQSIRILQPQLIEKDDASVLLWSPPPIPDISYSISSSSSSAAKSLEENDGPSLKRRKIIVKGRY